MSVGCDIWTLLVELGTPQHNTLCCKPFCKCRLSNNGLHLRGIAGLIKSSRGRTFVAVAPTLAVLPATILAHSRLRRLVSHIGWDLLSSGLTSGLVGRPSQQGTANLFRLATLQRRVAQFRSRARHVPNLHRRRTRAPSTTSKRCAPSSGLPGITATTSKTSTCSRPR